MEKDAATRPLTPEEEALKRSTDCVYFLASPLTCKKGSECDYRHSEGARVNPRDCYYWLNGNCLNPKCSFRHPPLDGLFGIPGATTMAALPSKPISTHQVPGMHAPASSNLNKPIVPCFFFQKGQCLKGDKCAFVHGPQSTAPQATLAPVPQHVGKASASVTQPLQPFKKDSWNLKECASHQNTANSIVARQFEVPPPMSGKSVQRTEIIANNGSALRKSMSPYPLDVELSRSQPFNVPVGNSVVSRSQPSNVVVVNDVTSMSRSNHSQPADERLQNGRNVDEFLGESSPGFDVLVENDIEDTDYLHNDDEFGREPVQGGRNSYPATDFEYHPSDYEPSIKHERDQLNGKDKYDNHERKHGRYDQEQRRSSSERIGDRRLMPDWRVRRREESPDVIDGLDLRHRLLKQRRLNGSRSAVSPDRHAEPRRRDDRYVEGERYRGRHSHKDDRHFPLESSISSRLQGRIKLPVRSSPDRPAGMRVDRDRPAGLRTDRERDRDRGIHRGRLSPTRPANYLERNHDRMKRRLDEDLAIENRNFRSQREGSDSLNFVGPKSLAELKTTSSNKNASFQGTGAISGDEKENSSSDEEEGALGSYASESTSNLRRIPSLSTVNDNRIAHNLQESNVTAADEEEEEGLIPEADEADQLPTKHANTVDEEEEEGVIPEADELDHLPAKDATPAVNEGTTAKDAEDEEEGLLPESAEAGYSPAKDTTEMEEDVVEFAEDKDAEYPDQRNEDWDYDEGLDEGDIKAEDNDTLYDEDYLEDEDDGDDFAKKVGMMFS